jgi:hypothetical protein
MRDIQNDNTGKDRLKNFHNYHYEKRIQLRGVFSHTYMLFSWFLIPFL